MNCRMLFSSSLPLSLSHPRMAASISSGSLNIHHWVRRFPTLVSASAAAGEAVAWKNVKGKKPCLLSTNCTPLEQSLNTQVEAIGEEEECGILCGTCNGRGWLLCDFCKGKKNNVKAENNRIYRRCPTCKAAGYVLCSECKVYKCITFPDYSDGELTYLH